MTAVTGSSTGRPSPPSRGSRLGAGARAAASVLRRGARWFSAFRRTRPFWGGLWLALGGYVVVRVSALPLGIALSGGWDRSAAYVLGGAMVLFGLTAWCAPVHARLVGLLGVLAALAAFVAATLGGFLVGTSLGILGGSMVWGWGEKKPGRRARRRAAARERDADDDG